MNYDLMKQALTEKISKLPKFYQDITQCPRYSHQLGEYNTFKKNMENAKQQMDKYKKENDERQQQYNDLQGQLELLQNRNITRIEKIKGKLIEKKMKDHSGYFDFIGDDNCEDCEGWDGESRRCQCGNRRVDWELDDGEKYIYAEAY